MRPSKPSRPIHLEPIKNSDSAAVVLEIAVAYSEVLPADIEIAIAPTYPDKVVDTADILAVDMRYKMVPTSHLRFPSD